LIRKNERTHYLLNYLRRTGQVSVSEAVEMLGVSEATVRRLFASMEQDGLALRSHGMLRSVPDRTMYSFEASAQVYSREKQNIGRMAAMFVEDGDIIYLDCGTTVFQMTLALSQRILAGEFRSLNIVTNSIVNVQALTPGPSCKLILVDPFVSSLHARLTFDSLNGLVIEDCDSANGVYVNGERILKQCKLTDDDTVRMGSSRLQFILAGPVRDEDGEETIPAGTRYRVPIDLILEYEDNGGLHREHMTLRDTARIGRDRRSEIYLDDTGVSHFHAKLINCGQGRVGIQDTDSVNGVLLNGAYIDKLELVRPNDEIMLGNVRMLVYYQEKK